MEVEGLLRATLLWLCAIPSPIGEERALCDARRAAPVRAAFASVHPALRRLHRRAADARAGGPRIALVGHLDTVRTENGPARIEGDRCFGAGASDMKSGLAVMIALAETLRLAELGCDLTLVFYAREEGPFADNELGPVLEHDPELGKVDLAVCLEPSDNKLHLGCMGSIHATVTFRGPHRAQRAALGGGQRDHGGGRAARRAAGPSPPRERPRRPRRTASVTTVTQARDGGRGRNVVPDQFVLNVNHRFAPDRSLDEAKADLVGLVRGRADVEFTDLSPAARPSAGHPLVRGLVAAGVRAVEPKQAWTDVARFAARGVAAVNFGPGENAQAHQKNESTSLPLVYEGYAIFARWLYGIKAA